MSTPVLLAVKIVPGSSRTMLAGWLGEALRIKVTAPPEKGRANAAVERFLADVLNLPIDAVKVIRGLTAARKTVQITGLNTQIIRDRLAQTMS